MDGNFETPEQKLEKIREEINAAKAVSDGRVSSEADEAAENGVGAGAYRLIGLDRVNNAAEPLRGGIDKRLRLVGA